MTPDGDAPRRQQPKPAELEELDRQLDERLKDTFPASDPIGPMDRPPSTPRY